MYSRALWERAPIPTTTSIPPIKEFPADGRVWRVDWFGGMVPSPDALSEPWVQTIISPVLPDAKDLSSTRSVDHSRQRVILVGVGQLPLLEIGSLWKNSRRLDAAAGKIVSLKNLTISAETVRLVRSSEQVDSDHLIRGLYHRIGAGLHANCIAIKFRNDPYGIIIPVIEVIRFYYANSTNLAKAVFLGDFKHDLSAIVDPAASGFIEDKKRCYIQLRQNIRDSDAFVIGRILCSPEAHAGVDLVHDSMMRQSLENKSTRYPEVGMPFAGTTTLSVRAKKMKIKDGTRWRYIVFAIDHCTAPFPFTSMLCGRDNNGGVAPKDTDNPDDEKEPAFVGSPSGRKANEYELQSEREPQRDSSAVIITLSSNRFGALDGMGIEKADKDECRYMSAGRAPSFKLGGDLGSELGTGDGTYSKCDVSRARVETRPKSLPATFDNFVAMIEHLDALPDYTASLREDDEDRAQIPLTEPESHRQWSYLDSASKKFRSVAIADVIHSGHIFTLIEFERRKSEDKAFRLAMVYRSDGQYINEGLVKALLFQLAIEQGIWKKVEPPLDEVLIVTLKHVWNSIEDYAAAVKAKILVLW